MIYLQHAVAYWKRNHGLRYYKYVIPEGLTVCDAVAIAYCVSFSREAGLPRVDGRNNEEDEESEVSGRDRS